MQKIKEQLRRDGWLLALLAACVALCLLLGRDGGAAVSAATQEESRLSAILSAIDGAGHVEAAVFRREEDNVPTGAVIVAEGADDLGVQLRLSRACMTLLALDADQIVICRLKEDTP